MTLKYKGATDCDVHIHVPDVRTLLPYMSDYWQDQIVNRYIDRSSFAITSYPDRSPLTCRADWRTQDGAPANSLDAMQANLLDRFGIGTAVCHALHGGMMLFNEDMGAEFCKAVNGWVAEKWLDADVRLCASILVHPQNPQLAVDEIECRAGDPRFVAVLMPVMADRPLGHRINWPVFEAAQKHGLSLAVHAGSTYRHSPGGGGWTSYQIEDYVHQSAAFQNMIVSCLAEGVFRKFPDITLVCMESGFTFLPTLLWRSSKTWRGVRAEVPWIDRVPAEIIRERVRFTLQPFDAPDDAAVLGRILEQIACEDVFLFSSDYPHWQFDGDNIVPDIFPDELLKKAMFDNPAAAFPRLKSRAEAQARGETVT